MKKIFTILFLFPFLIQAQTYQATETVWAGPGEYAGSLLNQANQYMYGNSGNPALMGTGGAGTGGIPGHCITTPTTQTFLSMWGMLHGFAGIGTDGYAQIVGDNFDGTYGDGTGTSISTAYKLLVDSAGNAFNNLVGMAAFFTGNAHNGWIACKSDGTLWVWGNLTDNMRANGTGGTTFVKPVQIIIPGGRSVIQVLAGFVALVLCSDGTVWAWGSGSGGYPALGYAGSGNQWATIHQVTGLTGITQIAGGEHWNYAYNSTTKKLYRWGAAGNYMGKAGGGSSGPGTSIPIPEEATELEAAMNLSVLSIKQIVVNSDATAAILSDGSLWAWGENVQGGVGNGIETNWATYTVTGTPFPYQNNLGSFGQLMQITPVKISNKNDWVALYGSSVFTYYFIARHANGTLATWGRNKGAVALNGIQLATSDLNATYPNSNDILSPTDMNPFGLTHAYLVTSPWCISNPGATYCSEFTHGPYAALSPSAGSNQSVTTNTVTLTGVVGDTTLAVGWRIISGSGTKADSANKSLTITGLSPGANTIQFSAINNGYATYTSNVTVTYTPPSGCNCVIGNKGRQKQPYNK